MKDWIKGKKVILIGEMHGTKEIPEMLSKFFLNYSKNNKFGLCFEISSSKQECELEKIFKTESENDGRRTKEYMDFIKKISKSKNVNIYFIDVEEGFNSNDFQNKREEIMAKNILNCPEEQVFAILGNIHVSKKEFKEFNIKPTGKWIFEKLKNRMVSINILPKKGEIFNITVEKIDSKLKFLKNYDHTIYLDLVTPATIL